MGNYGKNTQLVVNANLGLNEVSRAPLRAPADQTFEKRSDRAGNE
jgi:hypothetical protein